MSHENRIERAAETIGEPSDWAKLIAERVVVAYLGDTVLYEMKDISTQDAFVNGGMLAIDAVNGKHQGVLVQAYPEKGTEDG